MALTINHQTNDISATSGSMTIDGAAVGGGGGGADLYAANESSPSAQPSATGTNAVAIGDSAVASGLRSTAIGKARATATDTFAANISTNSNYGAQGTGSTAIGTNAHALGSQSIALGQGSYAGHSGAIAIGAGTYATGITSLALMVNYNSSYGALATSAVAIGNKAKASATQSIAIGNDALSTTANLIALGGASDTVKISGAFTLPTSDGSANQVLTTNGSGVVTFADAGGGGGGGADLYAANESSPSAQPSATGTNSIAIGESAVSTGRRALAVGTSRAAGNYSVAMMIGSNSTSYGTGSGSRSLAMGELARAVNGSYALGGQARAEGERSYVIGTESTAVRKRSMAFGYQSQPASEDTLSFAGGQFSSKGDAQRCFAVLRCLTTNATPATLTTNDNGIVSTNNQIILPNNSAFVFQGTLIAREQASSGTDVGAWKVEGSIRREGSAGTTTLIHNTVTAIGTAPSGWSLAITADTTYGAAKFAVTGAASTNIRWVLKLDTAEVSYA